MRPPRSGALNVLHLGMAFVLQMGLGAIAARWMPDALGHYPVAAYRWAFALPVGLQVLALSWFLLVPLVQTFEPEAKEAPQPAQSG